jgi:uncharacterized protein YndB with AHSA1/START domain
VSRKYERVFTVSVPVERAFDAMTNPEELENWMAPLRQVDDRTFRTEAPLDLDLGQIVVEEYEVNRRLRYVEPHEGRSFTTEVTVVFEELERGTRITFTRAGFDDGEDWDGLFDATAAGTDETLADLILYLETGVAFPRHFSEKSYHGLDPAIDTPAGVVVTDVATGTFADRLGLRRGDLLVELGGAAVYRRSDLWFFVREHGAGEEADAAWVREGRLVRGRAVLGLRERAVSQT